MLYFQSEFVQLQLPAMVLGQVIACQLLDVFSLCMSIHSKLSSPLNNLA